MHIFRTVPHHEPVDNIRVVTGFAQVIGQLKAVLDHAAQPRAAVALVEGPGPARNHLLQLGRLGGQGETDLLRKAQHTLGSDAQIVIRDLAGNTKSAEEALDIDQEFS